MNFGYVYFFGPFGFGPTLHLLLNLLPLLAQGLENPRLFVFRLICQKKALRVQGVRGSDKTNEASTSATAAPKRVFKPSTVAGSN